MAFEMLARREDPCVSCNRHDQQAECVWSLLGCNVADQQVVEGVFKPGNDRRGSNWDLLMTVDYTPLHRRVVALHFFENRVSLVHCRFPPLRSSRLSTATFTTTASAEFRFLSEESRC